MQPELVRGRKRRHDDLEPLERQRAGGQARLSGAPGCKRLGGRLPTGRIGPRRLRPRRQRLRQRTGPQQHRHVLEAVPQRQVGSTVAAITLRAGGQLGQLGLDHELGRPGRPRGSPGTAFAGELLDLVGGEHARSAVRLPAPAEHTPADVGIEARLLDAQPLRGLGRADPVGHLRSSCHHTDKIRVLINRGLTTARSRPHPVGNSPGATVAILIIINIDTPVQ